MRHFILTFFIILGTYSASAQIWEKIYESYLPSNQISEIAVTPNGTILFGAWNSGISVKKGEIWSVIPLTSSARIKSIKPIGNDTYWVGTEYGGLDLVKSGKAEAKVINLSVNDLSAESESKVWMATTYGLKLFDNGEISTFNNEN